MLTWRETDYPGGKSYNLDSDFSGLLAHIGVWQNPGQQKGWWSVRYAWDDRDFLLPDTSIESVKHHALLRVRNHLMAFVAEIENAL